MLTFHVALEEVQSLKGTQVLGVRSLRDTRSPRQIPINSVSGLGFFRIYGSGCWGRASHLGLGAVFWTFGSVASFLRGQNGLWNMFQGFDRVGCDLLVHANRIPQRKQE